MGGSGHPYLQYVLQRGHAGDTFVWIGDIGDDITDWLNPGGFSIQGGPMVREDSTMAQYRGALGIPDAGSGSVGDGSG